MKRFIIEFLRRGMIACGIGPIVLAILYIVSTKTSSVDCLTVNQVCIGIFSMATLAFIAGGLNSLYQFERIPLMIAILIHGSILYVSYLVTYLINDWLDRGIIPLVVFTAIFIVGYVVIWAIIYSIIKKNTNKINDILRQKQKND